MPQIIEMTV